MNREQRVELHDTPLDVIGKLSEGNPGAVRVLTEVYIRAKEIDPDVLDPLLTLCLFDSAGVYGCQVWMLYNDVCGGRIDLTLAVLRAWQLGMVPRAALLHAVENRGYGIDLASVRERLTGRLPNFRFAQDPAEATR